MSRHTPLIAAALAPMRAGASNCPDVERPEREFGPVPGETGPSLGLIAKAHYTRLIRQLPIACLLADRDGRCIDANPAWLAARERLGLQVQLGRVRFQAPAAQEAWQRSLAQTHATALPCEFLVVALAQQAWIVYVEPLLAGPAQEERLILALFLPKISAAELRPQPRCATALTRAEEQVLGAMLRGLSAKRIAQERGASFHTIRSQITSILQKTGRHSQRELLSDFGGRAPASPIPGDVRKASWI